MIGSVIDSYLARVARATALSRSASPARMLDTPVGPVRAIDTGGNAPAVLIVPDGPNVVEHYAALIGRLSGSVRVVCFDMPGFGFSPPSASYEHTLDHGADAVLGVLDALGLERATLAFSCANGFYALRTARRAPTRVTGLFLSQTPSLEAMHAWAARMIPLPVRVPAVGQLGVFLLRKQTARRWYDMALPRGVHAETRRAFVEPALHALSCGSCFSLAGVSQGLLRGQQSDITAPGVPCTMLWGPKDRTHRHTRAESLLACVPDAQIETLAGVGHFPDLERQDRFAELLLANVSRWERGPR